MHKIQDNITQVTTRIEKAALMAGRNPQEVTLLAVSKRQADGLLVEAYHAGQRHFGENYVQEAVAKQERLKLAEAVWHFIGPIQSNKTKTIAEHFDWVHSVDRLKAAQRLSDQRPKQLGPINICLQVNIDNENTKSGVHPDEAQALAEQIAAMPNVTLRGLMAIPQVTVSPSQSTSAFERMANLFENLKKVPALSHLDTLSMGMSRDLDVAIKCGSTAVRVGTAIFGPRIS